MSGWDLVYTDIGGEHMPGITKPWIHSQHRENTKQNKTQKPIASVLFPSLSGSCARRDLLRPPGVAGAPLTPGTFRAVGGRRGGGAMRHWTRGLGIRGKRAALPGPGYPGWRRRGTQCESPGAPVDRGRAPRGVCPRALLVSLLFPSAPSTATNDLGSLSFPYV